MNQQERIELGKLVGRVADFVEQFPHRSADTIPFDLIGSVLYKPLLVGLVSARLTGSRLSTSLFLNTFKWRLSIEQCSFGTQSIGVHQEEVTPATLLLEAGIAMTPPTTQANARAAYTLIRYGDYFDQLRANDCKNLVLPIECIEMESRLKTQISEELSLGISFLLMKRYLGVLHIADVSHAIVHNFVQLKSRKNKKRPDFCCLVQDRLCFVESKGRVTSVASAIKQGLEQLASVESISIPPYQHHYLIATHFAFENGKVPTTTHIVDPTFENDQPKSVDAVAQLIRLSYAKAFRYAHRDDLADSLVRGKNLDIDNFDLTENDFKAIGFDPFGNLMLISSEVLGQLRDNNISSLLSLIEPRQFSQLNKIVLSNGIALRIPT
ncbi:MAG: hypothetical protein K2Y22_04030 [Candidatus Obscuribacterales bacterium]|nr:hypothetical protein [Candidatus Obscuribacterales bacterium]